MSHQTSAVRSEERSESRQKTKSQSFPGKLVCKLTGQHFELRPVEVSDRGLGFLVHAFLANGIYELRCEGFSKSVEVIYCHNHLGIDNLYRAGLFLRESQFNLREYFESLDLLLEND